MRKEGYGLTPISIHTRSLDQKDVDILGALDLLGGKTSTEEIMYGFLQGVDLMRPYLKSCVFQIIHDYTRDSGPHPYNLYNEETHKWETPVSEYLEIISDIIAEIK